MLLRLRVTPCYDRALGWLVSFPSVFVNEVARFFHATFFAVLPDWRSFGGFSQTSLIGAQFRVSPDQRFGHACFAVS